MRDVHMRARFKERRRYVNVANAPANASMTATIAYATMGRLSKRNTFVLPRVASAGIAGNATHCQAALIATNGTRAQNTPRHPISPPT